jgi:hypothetical protein
MTKGPGYVFETDTLNYGGPADGSGDAPPRWYLKISSAGTYSRERVEWIRDALTKWLELHP